MSRTVHCHYSWCKPEGAILRVEVSTFSLKGAVRSWLEAIAIRLEAISLSFPAKLRSYHEFPKPMPSQTGSIYIYIGSFCHSAGLRETAATSKVKWGNSYYLEINDKSMWLGQTLLPSLYKTTL